MKPEGEIRNIIWQKNEYYNTSFWFEACFSRAQSCLKGSGILEAVEKYANDAFLTSRYLVTEFISEQQEA